MRWGHLYWNEHGTAIMAGTHTWQAFGRDLQQRFTDHRAGEKARAALLQKRMKEEDDARLFFVEIDELRQEGDLEDASHDRLIVDRLIKQIPGALALQVESAFDAEQQSLL